MQAHARSRWVQTVALGAIAAALAGCSTPAEAENAGGVSSTRACIILPDALSSSRWEQGDRPALDEAISDLGFEVEIGNAMGQPRNYADIAKRQLAKGCGVMVLVDFEGSAAEVLTAAKAQGAAVIAYERPLAGADYYVSYDNVEVGRLQGRSLVDGLLAAGKDPATARVVFLPGHPGDGSSAMLAEGAIEVMSAAGIVPASEAPGAWDRLAASAAVSAAISSLGGVDAVWAANDTNAIGATGALDTSGLTVPVTGQDATLEGLRNVLLGKQVSTVYKPYRDEAKATADLIISILNGTPLEAERTLDDGTPYFALSPVLITADKVSTVVRAGDVSVSKLCAGDVAAACAAHGIG